MVTAHAQRPQLMSPISRSVNQRTFKVGGVTVSITRDTDEPWKSKGQRLMSLGHSTDLQKKVVTNVVSLSTSNLVGISSVGKLAYVIARSLFIN